MLLIFYDEFYFVTKYHISICRWTCIERNYKINVMEEILILLNKGKKINIILQKKKIKTRKNKHSSFLLLDSWIEFHFLAIGNVDYFPLAKNKTFYQTNNTTIKRNKENKNLNLKVVVLNRCMAKCMRSNTLQTFYTGLL